MKKFIGIITLAAVLSASTSCSIRFGSSESSSSSSSESSAQPATMQIITAENKDESTSVSDGNISGHYPSVSIIVDVEGSEGSQGNVRVEYVSDRRIRSVAEYSGMISRSMSFEAEDGYSKNSYELLFEDNSVSVNIKGISIVNQLEGWMIPDISGTIKRSSETAVKYDISSWSNEMIAQAVNSYLSKSQDFSSCTISVSDISNCSADLKNASDNYFVSWGGNEDYAYIAVRNSDYYSDRFHLTDYYDPSASVPEPQTEAETQPVTEPPQPQTEAAADWHQIYVEEIRRYVSENQSNKDLMYEEFDIDRDGTPELFISTGEYHMAPCEMYTIKDGKLVYLGTHGEYGYVGYDVTRGLMVVSGGNQGYLFTSYIELKNAVLSEVFSHYTNEGAVATESEREYQIDGNYVTKEEFNAAIAQYENDQFISVGRAHNVLEVL